MTVVRRTRKGGFTLVEILIVVVILGILATIVIPQFSNASINAKENMLKDELRYLRTQIIVYRAQHKDVSPGYPGGDTGQSPTETDFVNQMTKHTDDVAWTQPLASEDVQGVALGSCGRGAQNSLSAKGSMGAKGGCLRLGGRRRTHCASESLLYFCVDAASALC